MIEFLFIGTQEAGTTWLMANLARPSDVWMPRVGARSRHVFAKYLIFVYRQRIPPARHRLTQQPTENERPTIKRPVTIGCLPIVNRRTRPTLVLFSERPGKAGTPTRFWKAAALGPFRKPQFTIAA